jgi:peptide deformylase
VIRPILKFGDSTLHGPAEEVREITGEIQTLVDDMIDTMYAAPGIGLAAPQVGMPLRIFVVDLSLGYTAGELMVFINPTFVEREGMQLEEEGCLSVPGFNATVMRPMRVVGTRSDGQEHIVEGKDLLAALSSTRWIWTACSSRPGSRHQARSHRQEDPEADTRRKMVKPATPLRIVFFGTPAFAVPTLHALLSSRHVVVGVVTQPDRPRGRGQRPQPSPVKQLAATHGSGRQPERLRDDISEALALDADLGVVAAHGKILTDAVLQTPRLADQRPRVVAAQISRRRPIHRVVMAGDTVTRHDHAW